MKTVKYLNWSYRIHHRRACCDCIPVVVWVCGDDEEDGDGDDGSAEKVEDHKLVAAAARIREAVATADRKVHFVDETLHHDYGCENR